MKKYKEYMDRIQASHTLHQRLLGLEAPAKRPVPWKRYGSLAAALVLVLGLGSYGLARNWDALCAGFRPTSALGPDTRPETADAEQPDIALVEPGDLAEPGERTLGGYEVVSGSGPNAMTSYHILPYIEYGIPDTRSEMALDWDVPRGSTQRDLTQADFAALFGGEENLSLHLDWGGYTLTGWAAWYEDGSLWGVYINGEKIPVGLPPYASYPCPRERFEFAFVTGNQSPPTCIVYPNGVVNEVWDVPVTAWAWDDPDGCSRRVEFLNGGCGFRFDLTSADQEQAELLVSRLTRWVVLEGLELDALSSDGAVLAHPWEADPDYSVGEPNWNDGGGDCPYCADGTPHTHPYDPSGTTGSAYTCPDCGETVSKDSIHFHLNGDGTYTCNSCGVTVEEGVKHYHETGDDLCTGLPVPYTCPDCGEIYMSGAEHHCAGGTHTCPTCGEVLPEGVAHDCAVCGLPLAPGTHTCEVCGQILPEGVEHSHGEQHHDSHHQDHH